MTIETFSQFLTEDPHPVAAAFRRLQDKSLALLSDTVGEPWQQDIEWFPPSAG